MSTKRFRPKFNIKKNDMVVVISGDYKNLTAPKKVSSVLYSDCKVIVEGVNIVKRHTKPTANKTQGGIVSKEAPIHISNVMLWDEKEKKGVRVKISREGSIIKRISKKSGEII